GARTETLAERGRRVSLESPARAGSHPRRRLSLRNASCDGLCEAGYFCPAASSSGRAVECGGAAFYCPEGSQAPLAVDAGYYTVGGTVATRAEQRNCPKGHYCAAGAQRECPAGRWGAEGSADAACSGPCEAGYYCPAKSTQQRAVSCGGASSFCPAGSAAPTPTRAGYVAVDRGDGPRAGFAGEGLCRQGGWCADGVQFSCPPGKFSAGIGFLTLRNSSVCLDCDEGYTCPGLGNVRGDAVPCGNATVFCPAASSEPIAVQRGFYAIFAAHRTAREAHDERPCPPGTYCAAGLQRDCPAGRYGSATAAAEPKCDGPCARGRYCEDERRADAFGAVCGSVAKFCPEGSTRPQFLREGFYSVGGGDDETRAEERRCEPGGWCSRGRRHLCLAGTYNEVYGAQDARACLNASKGHYIPSDGAVRPDAIECGGPSLICPVGGMKRPTRVRAGYFSTDGASATTRTAEAISPPGQYALGGLVLQCPAGRYG
ncbi:hypothetical protein M885DRAFT_73563, partial [Pelagophyceae sp. CCMP2097]